MTGDQLIDEGRRLARPCVYLRSTGEHLAGIWGGDGIIPCGDGPYRHWLSIETQYIPDGRSKSPGCLSIYTNEDDSTSGIVAIDDERILSEASEGLSLYAHPDSSLPPLEAVFKFGSSEVKRWLISNNWEPEWGYNDNFPDRTPTGIHEHNYQTQLPLFSGDAYAVLGGWHMPWPEGDWDEMVEKQLIVWTFADSEPWVEAWRYDNNYSVIQRIT